MERNAHDPSPEYAREWMYSGRSWPEQDWDLFLTNGKCDFVLLECAKDNTCPNQRFALHCLYFLVGDAVHANQIDQRKTQVKKLLLKIGPDDSKELNAWRDETRSLLNNETEFDYEYWCQHSL